MTAAKTLKVIGAILLLLSIALPMSTCTISVEPGPTSDNHALSLNGGSQEHASKREEQIYVLDHFDPMDLGSWISVLAFTWPIFVVGALRWKASGRISLTIRILEPFLLVGTYFVVEFASTFFADRREVGAYLAFVAIGIYAIGTLWNDIGLYQNWRNEKRA